MVWAQPERRARFNMDPMMNSNTEPTTLGETGSNGHRDPYALHDPADGRDCLCDGCQADYDQDAADDRAAREEDTCFREENERGKATAQKEEPSQKKGWFDGIMLEFWAHRLLDHESLLVRLQQSVADRTRELPWVYRQFLLQVVEICRGGIVIQAFAETVARRLHDVLSERQRKLIRSVLVLVTAMWLFKQTLDLVFDLVFLHPFSRLLVLAAAGIAAVNYPRVIGRIGKFLYRNRFAVKHSVENVLEESLEWIFSLSPVGRKRLKILFVAALLALVAFDLILGIRMLAESGYLHQTVKETTISQRM